MSLSTTSFDPVTTATSLAQASVQNMQQLLNTRSQAVQSTNTALSGLQSALSSFSTAMSGLSSLPGQSVTAYSATLSDSTVATAKASSTAVPGSYAISVAQIATQHSIAFANIPNTIVPSPPQPGSTITITFANGKTATVTLSAAGGSMGAGDIARAINQQAGGQATANVVSGTDAGGNPVTQLTLTSGTSGAQGGIASISYTDGSGATTAGELVPGVSFASATQLTPALDAEATINGVYVKQGSNTVTAIPGVTLTLTAAQAASAAPATLTVARDNSATAGQVQNFVNAYNTLKKSLDNLTAIGSDGTATGAFANDAGVRSLQDKLTSLLRQNYGGSTLFKLGVSADRKGTLSLDSDKLKQALDASPTALDDVLGNASLSAPSGLLGALSGLAQRWTNATSGQIQQRQLSQQQIGKLIADQQAQLTDQYNNAYSRYLDQFTRLQAVQTQMSQTSSMFDALKSS
ncbi:flagellar filament capping protein FliD [Roseateles sp. BYS78W]|uniref:Flagellar hook-associated protein 2 n=1 Tax=Pelomonas candidula TaxID=3299025 RepID=A0ABW7HGE4_9BURK